jgi:hypothetical protein
LVVIPAKPSAFEADAHGVELGHSTAVNTSATRWLLAALLAGACTQQPWPFERTEQHMCAWWAEGQATRVKVPSQRRWAAPKP